MLTIRHAAPDDLDAVTALEADCFPAAEAASRNSLAARLAVFADRFLLLEQDGRLVSMVNGMVTDLPDLSDDMYDDAAMHTPAGCWQMIFGVDTAPLHRRRGYAALLLRQMIAEARVQGRAGLVLTCKDRLIPYYSRFGFVNEGLSASIHGDAVWYQMRLTF